LRAGVPLNLNNPLKSFRYIQTRKTAVLEESVDRFYPGVKFEIYGNQGQLDAESGRCELGAISLDYSRLATELRFHVPDFARYALVFAFKGGATANVGRSSINIGGQNAFVASASQSVTLSYAADFEHLVLDVAADALIAKLEALIGEPATDRLEFKTTADFRRSATEDLRRQFMLLANQMDSHPAGLSPLALAELEQAMLVSFLTGQDSNYSIRLSRRLALAAPWQVRKAEAYIEANWDQPLTIEALAEVTGVSARTLFHSFKRSRGYSPMDFVKRLRLSHARKMLQDPDASTSVTSVAFACGFGNLGHFSGYYRHAFGETPSDTLRPVSKAYA
jgi:AraC-like DNA-binding protein